MPGVQMAAESLRKANDERIPEIIRRWAGDSARYGKV
jgi:hypothetical protein